MLIAVVVAVRNQADYLGEALDSIFAQTLPTAEVVVVDDGSTDDTARVARERGVKVLSIERQGPKVARLIGARETAAPWLTFLDGDDRLTPSHHELLLSAAEQAGTDAAYGMVAEFADAAVLASGKYEVRTEPQRVPLTGTCLVRRELYFSAMEADPDPKGHDWFPVAERVKSLAQVNELVLERRIHGANRTIVDRAEVHSAYLAAARAAILRARSEAEGR